MKGQFKKKESELHVWLSKSIELKNRIEFGVIRVWGVGKVRVGLGVLWSDLEYLDLLLGLSLVFGSEWWYFWFCIVDLICIWLLIWKMGAGTKLMKKIYILK